MGKFTKYDNPRRMKKKPWKIHPVWQGIGCLLLVLIPVVSYAGAVLLVDANLQKHWVPMPLEFYGPPVKPLLYGQLFVTLPLMALGFAVLVIFYSIVYRFVGPPRYGPTDAPPSRWRR